MNKTFQQRHKPEKLQDLVFPNENIEKILNRYVKRSTIKALLLYGPCGTGKSSIGKFLPQEIFGKDPEKSGDLFFFKGGSNRANETILEKIKNWTNYSSINQNPFKIVVIDELDMFTQGFQNTLSGLIDLREESCLFIFTTNFYDRIDERIISRCKRIEIERANSQRWLKRAKDILGKEKITVPSDKNLLSIIRSADGDCRDILGCLEDYVEQINLSKKGLKKVCLGKLPKVKII